jgi:hypothetical protein
MSDKPDPKSGGLVPSGNRELATRSSALAKRGLNLISQQTRIVRFPLDSSPRLKLYVLNPDVPMDDEQTEEAIEARGDITVPAGKKLRLYGINVEATEIASLIVLKPDDLQELILYGAPISDAGLMHIRGLTGLKVLYLLYTRVSDAGLAYLGRMTQLEAVDLNHTAMSDAGLVHLRKLTGLKKLYVSGTHVTAGGLEMLKQTLANCVVYP